MVFKKIFPSVSKQARKKKQEVDRVEDEIRSTQLVIAISGRWVHGNSKTEEVGMPPHSCSKYKCKTNTSQRHKKKITD